MSKIKFLIIALLFNISVANADVNLTISKADIPKTKIVLYGFETNNEAVKSDVDVILQKIKDNLATTNLFTVFRKEYDKSNLIPYKADGKYNPFSLIDQIPDFDKYSTLNIGAMLVGDVSVDEQGSLQIKIRLWDILDERQLFGKFYSAKKENYKRMSNIISDEIFKALTGEKSGHFNSQILYIAESGKSLKRIKRVAIMDFDGGNKKYLTGGHDLVLTPIFLKKPNEIMFLRYIGNKKPQIYNLNIQNTALKKVGGFLETTFAPSIHPQNSDVILFSMIEDGNSNIYEMNLLNGRVTKLTNDRSINVTPSYSPDGSKIIFSSDRSGSQKLYIMNADGSRLKQISREEGQYSKPMWSPDSNLIAFTKIRNGRFGIGVMTPDGRNEKMVISDYLVEGAKWSPNGRYLIYSKQQSAYGTKSIPELYIIDIVTGYERRLPTSPKEGASDPDWAMKW